MASLPRRVRIGPQHHRGGRAVPAVEVDDVAQAQVDDRIGVEHDERVAAEELARRRDGATGVEDRILLRVGDAHAVGAARHRAGGESVRPDGAG